MVSIQYVIMFFILGINLGIVIAINIFQSFEKEIKKILDKQDEVCYNKYRN